jgi:hypothetical protein
MAAERRVHHLAKDLFLDAGHNCLVYKKRPLDMGRREFAFFKFLFDHWPERHRAAELLDRVWSDVVVSENSVNQMAKRLHNRLAAWGIVHLIDVDGTHEGYSLKFANPPEIREELDRVTVTETQAIALDAAGNELWRFRFPDRIRAINGPEADWRIQRFDLHQDGNAGVLLSVRFRDTERPDSVFYFSSTGDLEWQREADAPLLNREGRPFERAWIIKHVAVFANERGCTVWAALANLAGWAGCILRIDECGSANVQFANAGHVEQLCPIRTSGGDCLIFCGENNDFDQAVAGMIGITDPPGCSVPGERLVYRYRNALEGLPRKYIRFPTTELISVRHKPYGHTTQVIRHADGVMVDVETGGGDAFYRYHFSNGLAPRYVFPSGSHEFSHHSFEDTGAITHSWLECPERQSPLTLSSWTPDSGWHPELIPWRDDPWSNR